MKEEERGGEELWGGVCIREGFTGEVAGEHPLECLERQIHHSSLTMWKSKNSENKVVS